MEPRLPPESDASAAARLALAPSAAAWERACRACRAWATVLMAAGCWERAEEGAGAAAEGRQLQLLGEAEGALGVRLRAGSLAGDGWERRSKCGESGRPQFKRVPAALKSAAVDRRQRHCMHRLLNSASPAQTAF